ncbi:patatin-like phospholipase family protein [Dysgonomonas sp. 520]|uniref:patatin-like phospholipase family protein n=1 Tax=Dysgonomonas sp. 520 TaxID=2302931 RepID=UPI0013D5606F|nr:patatin-like phospholipase family protein [Dysgonomonas sp. 520]NDW10250.1 phospholipase [Dysgonomonas sp. 520]
MNNSREYPYKLGLALSGGGAKGFAHLGVLQAMDEIGIKPQVIAGTSAGSLAGVLYADGYAPQEIAEIFKKKAFSEFAKFTIPSAGIFKSDKIETFLKQYLRAKTFEQLQTPLFVTATDIEEGISTHFSEGTLIPTIVASCSVPIIFTPKEIDGKYYVDGGLFKNFPVSVIKPLCEKIVGVNVAPLTKMKYKKSMLHVAERSFHYMSSSNTLYDRKLCDILIESTNVSKYTMFDLDHVDEIYKIGYDTSKEILLKELNKIKLVTI